MKKIVVFLFSIVLFQTVGTAQVDTIGKYPYLYYYNWPQTGVIHDGTIMCITGIEAVPAGITSSESNYWSATYPGGHICEYAVAQHTDDTIEAIGLAVAWGTGWYDDTMRVVLYDSAMNGLDSVSRLYNIRYDLMLADTSAHHFYYPGFVCDTSTDYASLGINVNDLPKTYVYFDFFKSPVYLYGDFHIGLRPDNDAMYCVNLPYPSTMYEWHSAPYNFNATYRLKIDNVWREKRFSTYVPIIFVIQKLPCEPVDSVSVVLGSDGCLTVDWEQPALQSSWTVRLTLPDGSEITQPTDTNHWEYCGLATNQRYTIHVRSRCDDINGYSWSDWGSGFSVGNAGITATEGPAFELNPNPASGTVTVSCEAMEGTLEVVDMQGRVVLTAPATQHTLDISRLAAGSYFVRLTTQDGSAVRHLQVE